KARRMREEDRKGHEEARADSIREAVGKLRPGEVIAVPNGKRGGLGVIVSSREGKPTVLTQDRRFFRLAARDFPDPPAVLTRIPLPRSGSARSSRYRRDVAAKLVSLRVRSPKVPKHRADPRVEREAAKLEERAAAHPCHDCPERGKHERWARRVDERAAPLSSVQRRIRVRTETLARQFDRVLSVLRDLGYVEGWDVTEKGRSLSRIYGEGDILVAEALSRGLFDGLEPAEVAALLSSVVYEGRERVPLSGNMPTPATEERYELLQRTWRTVRRTEDEHQVQLCRELEAGFAGPIFHWANGRPLDEVLAETEMAPGDFVRNCKQLLDLLRQVEDVARPEVAGLFGRARSAVLRGVVAYTGL
ncbi:MAG: DEAD/DEAH box helicase, partial [Actinomycetota bacterium]